MTKRYLDQIIEESSPGLFVELEVSRIQCPNCDRYALMPKTEHELDCANCGHEFILVDKTTVKFK